MLELLHKQFNEQINKLNFNDIEYLLYVLNNIITINCIYILVKYKYLYQSKMDRCFKISHLFTLIKISFI